MTATPISRKRRILRGTVSFLGTLTAVGAAGAAIWLGSAQIAARAEKLPAAAEIRPIPIVAAPLVTQSEYEVSTRYPGRVEARRELGLGFEQGGTVAKLTVDEGDRVSAGEEIARLDTRALDAERAAQIAARDALAAQAELAQLTADRQKTLLDRDHISKQRYDEARLAVAQIEAEIRAADAAIAAIDVALDKAVLRTPFDAVVGTRFLDEGTRVSGGQPVVQLYEDSADRFRVGLPRDLARKLHEGDAATVSIDGTEYDASILRIRDDIDPATRTQAVILALPPAADLPDGALGTFATTRRIVAEGAWVPSSALVEGLRGLWTVYLVEEGAEGPRARREAVEVLHSETGRVFVRGAFGETDMVIADGPHRVADRQPVTIAAGG